MLNKIQNILKKEGISRVDKGFVILLNGTSVEDWWGW